MRRLMRERRRRKGEVEKKDDSEQLKMRICARERQDREVHSSERSIAADVNDAPMIHVRQWRQRRGFQPCERENADPKG